MNEKLQKLISTVSENKTGVLAATALVVGLTAHVGSQEHQPDEHQSQPQQVETSTKNQSSQNASNLNEYTRRIRPLRDADPQRVDLQSVEVEPGVILGVVTTGANFPRGARLTTVAGCPGVVAAEGLVCILGDSASSWQILEIGCRDREEDPDHTWCEVKARNRGVRRDRLTALVRWEGN